jgi:hypothetical protein
MHAMGLLILLQSVSLMMRRNNPAYNNDDIEAYNIVHVGLHTNETNEGTYMHVSQ